MTDPATTTTPPPRRARPSPRRVGVLGSLLVHTGLAAAAIWVTARVLPAGPVAYSARGTVAEATDTHLPDPNTTGQTLPPMPAPPATAVPLPDDPPPADDSLDTAPQDAPVIEPSTDTPVADWAAILAAYDHRPRPAQPQAPATAAPTAGGRVDAPPLTPPQAIYQPAPPRPRVARARRGIVLLRLHIDTDGTPTDVVVHRSSGSAPLDAAARRTAATWRFRPATREGRPVATWVEIPVRF